MQKQILIVDDEPSIVLNIQYALKQEGFVSNAASTSAQALQMLAALTYDLLILDVGLPDGSGFDLCRQIRSSSSIPIILVTARADEIDRILGLEIGADDYVTKPFSPRELATRVKTVLRRGVPEKASLHASPSQAEVPFQIDNERFLISYFGSRLTLSRYEFFILKTLIAKPGRVFSRELLMSLIWEDPSMSMERTVDSHIKSIRAKLRACHPDHDPIVTHRGLGYSLIEKW